jgi:hypothetical protein
MAPSRSQPLNSRSNRLEVPTRKPFYTPKSKTSEINTISASSSTSDLHSAYLPPTTLDAIARPSSCGTAPSMHFRKNMKDFTGFDTTEDEFEALPLAVRRKVCRVIFPTYSLPQERAWSVERSMRNIGEKHENTNWGGQ